MGWLSQQREARHTRASYYREGEVREVKSGDSWAYDHPLYLWGNFRVWSPPIPPFDIELLSSI